MKTKVRLCKLLFSTRLLLTLLIILGILECLHWLQQGVGRESNNDRLILEDYPELSSSMKSSSNFFPSSSNLPEQAASTSTQLIQVKSNPKKKKTAHDHQNILLLAYARSGKPKIF